MLTATPEQDKEAASRQEAQAELVSPSASDTATAVMPECWERAEPAAVAAIAVPAAGGGGGSSYTKPELCSEVVHTQGFRSGAGYIILS